MNTFNVAAAWENIFRNATLGSSSAATAMPVSMLQQQDISRHFRSAPGNTVDVDASFAVAQSADTFDILGTNLTAAGTVRIRLSNVALGNTDIWDSGTIASNLVDPIFLAAPRLRGEDALVLTTPKSGWKYCRMTLTDNTLSAVEAGYLVGSTRTQLSYNFNYGAQFTVVDPSEQKKTSGGMTNIRSKPKFRRCELTVGALTEAQRWSVFEAIGLANGVSVPLLLITDPSSSNLGRASIFGLLQDSIPVTSIEGFDNATGRPVYSASVRLDERL